MKVDKKKIERLKEVFEGLEETDIVREYLIYINATPVEKIRLKKDGNEYYKKVPNTKAFKRWKKIKELYKQRKFTLMKQFCNKATKQLESQDFELSTPSKYDPDFFFSNSTVNSYINIKKFIKDNSWSF